MMPRRWPQRIGVLLSVLSCLLFLAPIVWLITTSFKPTNEIAAMPPIWIFTPTLEHYQEYMARARIFERYTNTVIVAVGASLFSVAVGALCGYALARLRISGGATLSALILASRAIPPIALVVPMYMVARQLDMLDKHITLILAYTTFLVPYVVWLMRGFFMDLPPALEEAALIDGCSRLGAFFRVVVPCSLPGLTATLIFCVILAWNELLFALILTNREAVTIPVSLAGIAADTERGALWGPLTAVGTLTVVPVVLFALAVQRYLIRGLAHGSMAN